MAKSDTSTLSISREIAGTAGMPRRIAVLTGSVLGAMIAIDGYLHGASLATAIVSWALWAMAFIPVVVVGLAQGQLMERMVTEPRPRRTPAEMEVLWARMRVATWIMALTSLALSLYVLFK